MLSIVSAVGQLEQDIIKVRVNGICYAHTDGKRLGLATVKLNCEQILELRSQGHSLQEIATDLGIGYGTVPAASSPRWAWCTTRPAAIQFLTTLAEKELLRLAPDMAAWIWDLDRICSKGCAFIHSLRALLSFAHRPSSNADRGRKCPEHR